MSSPTRSVSIAGARGGWLAVVCLTVFMLLAPGVTFASDSAPDSSSDFAGIMSEEWLNILFQGQKIGFSYQKIEKSETGYTITDKAVIRLTVMGISQDMSFSNVSQLGENKRLKNFVYLQTIQDQRQKTAGVVKDGAIELSVTGAGGTVTKIVEIEPETRFADLLKFEYADKLKVGFKKIVPVFITALRAVAPMTLEVVDRKKVKFEGGMVDTFVVNSSLQDVKTVSYVTPEGMTVREESFMGFRSERTSEEVALKFTGAHVPITSLITFSLITPDKPIENPQDLTALDIKMGGLNNPDIVPEDNRQTVGESQRVFDESRKRSFTAPVSLRKVEPEGRIDIEQAAKAEPEHLKPTPEIQSDNKIIIDHARKIVGAETDVWKASRKINQWVYENLEKEFVDSFTALDVLFTRKGECQSHTNLFTAFARSVGIPAKVASGLVYSPKHGGFLYHAWPEVYVGQWVAVDPTLGQDVADVTHIKLVEGGVENQIKLVRFIGRITISVDSIE